MSLIAVFNWLQILMGLWVSWFFGPLVNIFLNMLKDLLKFSLLFMLIFAIFLFVALIALNSLPIFRDPWPAFWLLFASTVGNLDLEFFNNITGVDSWFAQGLIIFMFVILNITLLNFVIAILGKTYETIKENA